MRSIRTATALLIGLFGVSGCAEPPTNDVAVVKAALEEARKAHAAEYAPFAWNAAVLAKERLETELEIQSRRLAPFRSYDQARNLAVAAISAAAAASDAAAAGMQRAKEDANSKIAKARAARWSLDGDLAAAPHARWTEAALVGLESGERSIDSTLMAAQSAFDAGDYLGARAKAESVIVRCQDLEAEIEMAAELSPSSPRT